MRFKKPIIFVWILVLACFFKAFPVSAHTLYMNLADNEDGTVAVEAMFSTGATGAGLPLFLEDDNGRVIQTLKLDENGEVVFDIPDRPYTVFLDGGPGHTVRKKGPGKP